MDDHSDGYRFSLRKALEICADTDERATWLSTVNLAQIIVWAFVLKQRKRRKFSSSSSYARQAGLQAISMYLQASIDRKSPPDQVLLSGTGGLDPSLVLAMFVLLGGFRASVRARTWSSFRSKVQKRRARIDSVFLIADYLTRMPGHDRVLDTAYSYVMAVSNDRSLLPDTPTNLHVESVKRDAVMKYWLTYRDSAPIIYAVRRNCPTLWESKTVEAFITELHTVCLDSARRLRLVGEAAFAADLIAGVTSHFDAKPYRNLSRATPKLADISNKEKDLIASIVREKKQGCDDSPDYRAPMVKRH